jgi:hypothetical protein
MSGDNVKTENGKTTDPTDDNTDNESNSNAKYGDRILAISGYALVMVAVFSFAVIAFINLRVSVGKGEQIQYETWLSFIQSQTATISLIIIAVVAASLGKRLLTTVRLSEARTIPAEDLPLVKKAVIEGKSDPVDQYVRLRSLTGMSGTFTKLGVTGLPLTTVLLTLVFSFIALCSGEMNKDFLDLAKLTLGAFIGSFVQRNVEQRRVESAQAPGEKPPPELPA